MKVSLIQWNMTNAEGSLTGLVNQPSAFTVSWPYTSGSCDFLDKFEESRQGSIIFIKAYGHVNKGVCTDDAGTKTKIYNFTSITPGTFELRFINKDSSFISRMITIN
ncbi:MAG: hypothetical protein ABI091_30845 [Ferruginibacter sp.]